MGGNDDSDSRGHGAPEAPGKEGRKEGRTNVLRNALRTTFRLWPGPRDGYSIRVSAQCKKEIERRGAGKYVETLVYNNVRDATPVTQLEVEDLERRLAEAKARAVVAVAAEDEGFEEAWRELEQNGVAWKSREEWVVGYLRSEPGLDFLHRRGVFEAQIVERYRQRRGSLKPDVVQRGP